MEADSYQTDDKVIYSWFPWQCRFLSNINPVTNGSQVFFSSRCDRMLKARLLHLFLLSSSWTNDDNANGVTSGQKNISTTKNGCDICIKNSNFKTRRNDVSCHMYFYRLSSVTGRIPGVAWKTKRFPWTPATCLLREHGVYKVTGLNEPLRGQGSECGKFKSNYSFKKKKREVSHTSRVQVIKRNYLRAPRIIQS